MPLGSQGMVLWVAFHYMRSLLVGQTHNTPRIALLTTARGCAHDGTMRTTALAILAAAALTLNATVATAEPVNSPEIASYMKLAEAYWQTPPPCAVTLERAELSADDRLWAVTTPDCVISLDPDYYPRPATLPAGYWRAQMCSIITHEYGHLLGQPHTTGTRSIMNPYTPLNVVPGCPWWQAPGHGRVIRLHRAVKRHKTPAWLKPITGASSRHRDGTSRIPRLPPPAL